MAEPVSVDGHLNVTLVTEAAPTATETATAATDTANAPAATAKDERQLALVPYNPYNIITVEKKPAVPTSALSSTLTAFGLANTTFNVSALIFNVVMAGRNGQEDLLPAKLFAAGQCFEHCEWSLRAIMSLC